MAQPLRKPAADKKRYVGSSVERIEDLRFLRGKGTYVDDVILDQDVLHAVILRSPVAHGYIRGIDATAARKIDGVHAVITAAEIIASCGAVPLIPIRLHPIPVLDPYKQPVIASDKVRHVGEPIAIIVAVSAAIAEDAMNAIELDIESLPVAADVASAIAKKDGAILFDGTDTNAPLTYTAKKGDADAVFASAPYKRRERFEVQRITAMTMEPRGLMAAWDAASETLVVYGAAKVPFWNRAAVAQMLGMQKDAVTLIENDVGGGFGARGEFYTEDFLIPFAARHLGRAVKWIEDRRENLMAMNQARECDAEVEIACDRDGTILGFRGSMHYDLGAYPRTNGLVAPRNLTQFVSGPYRVAAIDLSCNIVFTNKTGSGTFRAPGRFESNFFGERLVDMAAKDLGLDPVEMRRKNVLTNADMPWALATISPSTVPNTSDTSCDSGDYRNTLDRCVQEFGWAKKRELQGKLIDGRYHGIGFGCFIEGGAAGPRENAKVHLDKDGIVTVSVGSTGVGQGLETVLLQIAADALDMPMDDIRLLHGSTNLLGEGWGSYHSRSTVMGGSAILDGAKNLKAAICDRAAALLGCTAAEVHVAGGEAISPKGKAVSLATLAATAPIEVDGTFASHHHTYAYGAAAAHVAVDPGTGRVELVDYVVIEDVGRAINPLTVHGQVVGGTVQGLGGVFLEHIVYDAEGQLLTGSLADYLVPTATDYPQIRAVTLEQYPSPLNPLGAKGAGEGGTIVVGSVIGNALANALSSLKIQPNVLPFSPMRVWQMVDAARRKSA
jgi:carbon-monoxide dehydrogenase large subunit